MPSKQQLFATAVADTIPAIRLIRQKVYSYSGPAHERCEASIEAAMAVGYTAQQIENEAARRIDGR